MIDMKVKDYRITSDENQITVNKVRRDEQGNIRIMIDKNSKKETESLSFVGYYGTLEQALNGIVRNHTGSDAVVIKTINDFKKACDDIVRAFKNEIELGVQTNDTKI